jgi:hypothetical protein
MAVNVISNFTGVVGAGINYLYSGAKDLLGGAASGQSWDQIKDHIKTDWGLNTGFNFANLVTKVMPKPLATVWNICSGICNGAISQAKGQDIDKQYSKQQ